MTRIKDLHKKWIKNADYAREYDALEEEFALASALIEARARAGLTQEELAEKMDTSQSAMPHGKRPLGAIRHHPPALCQGDGDPFAYFIRTGSQAQARLDFFRP